MINTKKEKALFSLIIESFNYNYMFTSLHKGWNSITLFNDQDSTFTFLFQTFNDLLEK